MIDTYFFEAFKGEEVILALAAGDDIRGKLVAIGSQWLTMETSSSNKHFVRIDNVVGIRCKKDKPDSSRVFCEF
jgi:hypothetical protein